MWLYSIARISWITEAWDEFSKVCHKWLANSDSELRERMDKEFHKS